MKLSNARKHTIYIALLMLGVIAYQILLTEHGSIDYYYNMDTRFHLARILGLSNAWRSPVNFATFAHHGTMMNVFYPWLTLYPAYLIFAVCGNLLTAWNLFLGLTTAATALLAYWSFLTVKKSPAAAFTFSALYTFSTYHTANMYLRSAIGETLAMAFLPLAFAGVYHILAKDWHRWPLLTFGMVLVVYSHLLSLALNAAYILLFIILALPFMNHRGQRALAMAKAAAFALLMSLPALVPMLLQSRKDDLLIPTASRLNWLQTPSDLFDNFLNNDIARYSAGLLIGLALLWLLVHFKQLAKDDRIITIVALGTLVATSFLFPWHLLSFLHFAKIQYVMRFNSYLTLFVAFAFAKSFTFSSKRTYNWLGALGLIAITMALTMSSATKLRTDGFRTHTTFTTSTVYGQAAGYNHTDYGNKAAKTNPQVINGYQFLLDGQLMQARYHYTASTYTATIHADHAGTLITPLYRYTGQEMRVNGKSVKTTVSRYGTTAVKVPRGQVTLRVSYHYSTATKACAVIAILSTLMLIVVCVIERRMRRNQRGIAVTQ